MGPGPGLSQKKFKLYVSIIWKNPQGIISLMRCQSAFYQWINSRGFFSLMAAEAYFRESHQPSNYIIAFAVPSVRKFPGNFLMQAGVSDPGSIREFPGNFLMEPRKKFKLFLDTNLTMNILHIWIYGKR